METHKEYFNRLAPEWSQLMPDDPAFRDLLTSFGIIPGDVILDLGTGNGKMAGHLSSLTGNTGYVIAQDIAENMVRHGRNLQPKTNIYWLCEDAESLSYPEFTFDKILCFSAFPHFQDQQTALREMVRVLKPEGKLLVLHINSSEELNAFHATRDGPVSGDTLPAGSELGELFRHTGLIPEDIRETDDLYWVCGRKPASKS